MINILDIPKLKKVTAKLGKMRKEQTFLPQRLSDGRIIVQSDKSIGVLDLDTGKGRLCTTGCYFPHLALAKPFDFPADFVAQVREAIGHARQFEVEIA